MLAYSSVAHSGYMLVALMAGPQIILAGQSKTTDQISASLASPLRDGLGAVLFYIVIYGVMNLGAFAAISFLRKTSDEGEDDSVESFEDLSGAGRTHPWAAIALAICVLGLMGLPPTGGFLGKLYVFSSAISAASGSPHEKAILALVVIGVLNSAIAAAYYLRIIAACYLGKPASGVTASRCPGLQIGLALCATLVMVVFIRPGFLFENAQAAVANLTSAADSTHVTKVLDDDLP
jgi:NADH-quinone oxidoreductase subunit N